MQYILYRKWLLSHDDLSRAIVPGISFQKTIFESIFWDIIFLGNRKRYLILQILNKRTWLFHAFDIKTGFEMRRKLANMDLSTAFTNSLVFPFSLEKYDLLLYISNRRNKAGNSLPVFSYKISILHCFHKEWMVKN